MKNNMNRFNYFTYLINNTLNIEVLSSTHNSGSIC